MLKTNINTCKEFVCTCLKSVLEFWRSLEEEYIDDDNVKRLFENICCYDISYVLLKVLFLQKSYLHININIFLKHSILYQINI